MHAHRKESLIGLCNQCIGDLCQNCFEKILNVKKLFPNHVLRQITFKPGDLGIKLDGSAIDGVVGDGQAIKLGVRTGWRILSINGIPQPNDRRYVIQTVKSAPPNKPITMVFYSPQVQRQIIFESGGLGLKLKGNTIDALVNDGQAIKFGVRAGWRILSINNIPQLDDRLAIIKTVKSLPPKQPITIIFSVPRDSISKKDVLADERGKNITNKSINGNNSDNAHVNDIITKDQEETHIHKNNIDVKMSANDNNKTQKIQIKENIISETQRTVEDTKIKTEMKDKNTTVENATQENTSTQTHPKIDIDTNKKESEVELTNKEKNSKNEVDEIKKDTKEKTIPMEIDSQEKVTKLINEPSSDNLVHDLESKLECSKVDTDSKVQVDTLKINSGVGAKGENELQEHDLKTVAIMKKNENMESETNKDVHMESVIAKDNDQSTMVIKENKTEKLEKEEDNKIVLENETINAEVLKALDPNLKKIEDSGTPQKQTRPCKKNNFFIINDIDFNNPLVYHEFQPLRLLCDRCIHPVAQCHICVCRLSHDKFYSPEPSICLWKEDDVKGTRRYKTSTYAHDKVERRQKRNGYDIAKNNKKRALPILFSVEEEKAFKKKCLEKKLTFWIDDDSRVINFEFDQNLVGHVKGRGLRALHQIEKKTGSNIKIDHHGRGRIRNLHANDRKFAIEQILLVLDFVTNKRKKEDVEKEFSKTIMEGTSPRKKQKLIDDKKVPEKAQMHIDAGSFKETNKASILVDSKEHSKIKKLEHDEKKKNEHTKDLQEDDKNMTIHNEKEIVNKKYEHDEKKKNEYIQDPKKDYENMEVNNDKENINNGIDDKEIKKNEDIEDSQRSDENMEIYNEKEIMDNDTERKKEQYPKTSTLTDSKELYKEDESEPEEEEIPEPEEEIPEPEEEELPEPEEEKINEPIQDPQDHDSNAVVSNEKEEINNDTESEMKQHTKTSTSGDSNELSKHEESNQEESKHEESKQEESKQEKEKKNQHIQDPQEHDKNTEMNNEKENVNHDIGSEKEKCTVDTLMTAVNKNTKEKDVILKHPETELNQNRDVETTR